MRHIGSHSLGEFPVVVVRIDGLMARFGPDIALLDLLVGRAPLTRWSTPTHSTRGQPR
jgi:hypothetical protein